MRELKIDEKSINYPVRDRINLRGFNIDVPSLYRGKCLNMLLPVSTEKLAKHINFDGLRPVEVFWGRSLLCITLFDFLQSPVGPYTELVLSTFVERNSNFKIPLLSLIKDQVYNRFNLFIIDIAQNTEIAVEHGNLLTGYPHNPNLINIKFEEEDDSIFIKSFDSKKHILDVEISKPKKERIIKESYITYFSKNEVFYKIQMDIHGIAGNVAVNKLNLGNHELAEFIKSLSVSRKPFQVRYSRDVIEINPVLKEKV